MSTTAILTAPRVQGRVDELAAQLGRDREDVVAELGRCLDELAATHRPAAAKAWSRIGHWVFRAYDLEVDESALGRLRALDRTHTLVWLPSHRSYLDGFVLPDLLARRGFSAVYTMGGINLDFWPLGPLARRTGIVFIRRSVTDDPVYRLALREYLRHLVVQRANLTWMIEGGRTRTGKLRPPRYGILRYVADAAREEPRAEVMVVPVSIVYDQLHEVGLMASEARGAGKRPEDLRWLATFMRQQSKRLGRAYLDLGDPLPLQERLAEMDDDPAARPHAVERIALEVCHRINRATPATPVAIVAVALLAADRALTLDEVLATCEPIVRYLEQRDWRIAGGADLRDPGLVRATLAELIASDVVTCYEGGTEPVWRIGPDQHLVAAFYRNTIIHIYVNRAIGELVLAAGVGVGAEAAEEALRLRDLLKFEFFFPRKRDFIAELQAEAARPDPGPYVAHLVLRPFLEAYLVVAERLAARDPADPLDDRRFLDECLGVGRQWSYQRLLASEESVSLELFGTALRLAAHRGLLAAGEGVEKRREAFADEVREAVRRVRIVADRAEAGEEAVAR